MRHVISSLVQNVPGVLSHISGMLASRGYNIESLAVGETDDSIRDEPGCCSRSTPILAKTRKPVIKRLLSLEFEILQVQAE